MIFLRGLRTMLLISKRRVHYAHADSNVLVDKPTIVVRGAHPTDTTLTMYKLYRMSIIRRGAGAGIGQPEVHIVVSP